MTQAVIRKIQTQKYKFPPMVLQLAFVVDTVIVARIYLQALRFSSANYNFIIRLS
jgi:hypothetical protein